MHDNLACEFGNFRHDRILPEGKLVMGETVTGDDLTIFLRPQQRAHLSKQQPHVSILADKRKRQHHYRINNPSVDHLFNPPR